LPEKVLPLGPEAALQVLATEGPLYPSLAEIRLAIMIELETAPPAPASGVLEQKRVTGIWIEDQLRVWLRPGAA
jgi:hypothetical protein